MSHRGHRVELVHLDLVLARSPPLSEQLRVRVALKTSSRARVENGRGDNLLLAGSIT